MRRRNPIHYWGHIVYVDPVAPGLWRYRVFVVRQYSSNLIRHGQLVCDRTTFTRWAAMSRAKHVARSRNHRNARYP